MKKITGSLPFRLLLGVILGIIVGQLAGNGLMHVVVTIKYILNQVIVSLCASYHYRIHCPFHHKAGQ